jgi:hypothetical protein
LRNSPLEEVEIPFISRWALIFVVEARLQSRRQNGRGF